MMNRSIVIEVRGEPVGKGSVRVEKFVNRIPTKSREWMELVRHRAQLVAPSELIACPVRVDIEARMLPAKTMPKWKRRAALAGVIRPGKKPDIDNIMKGVADSLSGVIWRDDAQVVRANLEKVYSETPGITVTVTPLPEPTSAAEWKAWHQESLA